MKETIQKQNDFFKTQITKDVNYRLGVLRVLRKEIVKRESDIIKALYDDFKKSEFEVISSEIGVVVAELDKIISNLKKWNKSKKVFPSILNFPSSARIYNDPYGTVLILAPWNYPFNLAFVPLIGAIAGGNTVVLKPSELTENTSNIIKEIVETVFKDEYVAVFEGNYKVAQELLDQKWDYIFFTGSVRVGKIVYEAAAKHLTPVTLELGGKSPVIIDKTANVSLAAKRIVWGKFINAGQTCIAPDYILIDKEIRDEFVEHLKKEIEKAYGINQQMSKDYPRIINKANFTRLCNMLDDQNIVFGGKIDEKTLYISPTIILEPKLESEIMQYEIFGPLLPVISYESKEVIEDIIKLHPNPLSFYIFSKDKKVQNYYIKKYSFGGGVINDSVVHFVNDRLPFGGVGNSGINSYHGKTSFYTFTRKKSIVKRANWLDVPIRYLPSTEMKKKILRFIFMKKL